VIDVVAPSLSDCEYVRAHPAAFEKIGTLISDRTISNHFKF